MNFTTFGESHGKAVGVIVEGLPAGLKVKSDEINHELSRRQKGYGRGGRMSVEKDEVRIISGVRWGETIGSPVCLLIENRDWRNNEAKMSVDGKLRDKKLYLTKPRPGHADLAGLLKYGRQDITDILERSSARETAARVAAGSLFKKYLAEFNMKIFSWVIEIGGVKLSSVHQAPPEKMFAAAEKSQIRVPNPSAEAAMIKKIDAAKNSGDTVGGVFSVVATGVPVGLGSYAAWHERLDGKIAAAMMSIPAIKGVEIGAGFGVGRLYGSEVHDEIFYGNPRGHMWSSAAARHSGASESNRYYRKTNNAGGIEGGISNGENIVVNCAMKPIPTLMKPLKSVDIVTKKAAVAATVRSDVCAVPAASVVAEAMLAFVLAASFREKFGGDSISETKNNFESYRKNLK